MLIYIPGSEVRRLAIPFHFSPCSDRGSNADRGEEFLQHSHFIILNVFKFSL